MKEPRISRPDFPEGYLRNPKTYLPWSHVEQRMTESLHYWLCTVRPDGRPHTVPRWGVWLDNRLYYDGSPETLHALNLVHNPQVSLHLESGENVVIMYGTAHETDKPNPELAQRLAQAIGEKYGERGYTPNWTNGTRAVCSSWPQRPCWPGHSSWKILMQPALFLIANQRNDNDANTKSRTAPA